MLFRRPKSIQSSIPIDLRGLEPHANYEVTFASGQEAPVKKSLRGGDLAHLQVTIAAPGSSLLVRYRELGHG